MQVSNTAWIQSGALLKCLLESRDLHCASRKELRRAARGGEAEHHQEQRRPPRPIATPAERQPEAVLLQRGALKRHGGVQTSTGAAGMSVLSVASRAQESPTLDLVIAMPGLVRLDLCHRMGCPHREERGGEEKRRGEERGRPPPRRACREGSGRRAARQTSGPPPAREGGAATPSSCMAGSTDGFGGDRHDRRAPRRTGCSATQNRT